jgi:hypothetical protein
VAGEEAVFDRVETCDPAGNVQSFTRQQFAALPINERVRVLLHMQPTFYKNGAKVSAREAVKSL